MSNAIVCWSVAAKRKRRSCESSNQGELIRGIRANTRHAILPISSNRIRDAARRPARTLCAGVSENDWCEVVESAQAFPLLLANTRHEISSNSVAVWWAKTRREKLTPTATAAHHSNCRPITVRPRGRIIRRAATHHQFQPPCNWSARISNDEKTRVLRRRGRRFLAVLLRAAQDGSGNTLQEISPPSRVAQHRAGCGRGDQ